LDQAAQKGIRIDTLSFIETEPIQGAALTHQVQQLGSQPLTAVFTSMNAVEAVAAHLAGSSPQWQLFCIGAATRRLAEEHLGPVTGAAPSAAALADVILEHHPSGVFFFCGDQRREELPDRLNAAGIHVHELVVYKTTRTPQRVENVYDGVVFFSPSAVHSFFSVNAITQKTTLFAIGTTTADTIHTYVKNPVITSATPEKEALVRQLIDHFEH
jgi:uroporphyrinogen-III synthase